MRRSIPIQRWGGADRASAWQWARIRFPLQSRVGKCAGFSRQCKKRNFVASSRPYFKKYSGGADHATPQLLRQDEHTALEKTASRLVSLSHQFTPNSDNAERKQLMHLYAGSPRARCGRLLVIATLLTLFSSSSWAASPHPDQGYYFGTTTGACEDGAFGLAVRADGSAIVIRIDEEDGDGGLLTDATIEPDGSFFLENIDGEGTNVSGTISDTTVSGTINEGACIGTFTGTKACDDPILMTGEAGLYRGSAVGTVVAPGEGEDTLSGTWDLLVAPDGQTFGLGMVYAPNFQEELADGGPLSTAANGTVTGTFIGGSVVSGDLNFAEGAGDGSLSFTGDLLEGGPAGTVALTWDVSQTEAIECPEPKATLLAGTALLMIAGLRGKRRRSQTAQPKY